MLPALAKQASEQWFQIQDLIVETIMPQMLFLAESVLLFFERID